MTRTDTHRDRSTLAVLDGSAKSCDLYTESATGKVAAFRARELRAFCA